MAMADFGMLGIAGVMTAWAAFAVAFIVRRWSMPRASQRRQPIAWLGIALQATAFACIWNARRVPLGAPLVPDHRLVNGVLIVACVVLAWISAALAQWAIVTLGRQWAFSARLVEGHRLVTTGPYRFVRNPIYTGLFGLAMATAGVLSRPWTIIVGAPLFLAGTLIRVRAEERLLRDRFGPEYDAFARRVPAIVPLPRKERSNG